MEKQIQKIEHALEKIDQVELKILEGEYPKTGLYIIQLLEKRRKILEKTHKKIKRFNEDALINFSY